MSESTGTLTVPKWLLWLIIVPLMGTLNLPITVGAQTSAGVKMTAQAGFEDYCKLNTWIPVKVSLENSGPAIMGRIEARIQSSSGNTYAYATPIDLPEGSHKEFFLYLFTDSYLIEQPIYLIDGEQVLLTYKARLNCLPQTDLLFGVVASTPSSFNVLNELDPENGNASVATINIDALPDRAQGWEALDVLFFSDVDTAVLTIEQKTALEGWLANGGRLVVSGGTGWQKTAAGLEKILPIVPGNIQNLDSFHALTIFSDNSFPLPVLLQPIPISSGELKSGAMSLVEQEGIPLVVRKQFGLGDIFYLAFDPSIAPIKTWDGMKDFYRSIFAYQYDQPGWAYGFQNWRLAQEAASSLPSIMLPSAIFICGFLGIYMAVVGPVNYLILRHIKRRELTWITIPALVVIFSILTLVIGGISRGKTPLINQVSIVQVWPETGLARIDALTGIYSPKRTTYQVSITQQALARPIITYNPGSQDMVFLQSTKNLSIPGLRVDIGALETFASDGITDAYPVDNQLRLIINQSGAVINGQVVNKGNQTLKDTVLLYPGGVYILGDFSPEVSYDINVPLDLAQASGQPQSTSYSPYKAYSTPSISYPYYDYGYYVDPTLQDILGTTTYYEDKEIYQRFTLLNSALSNDTNSSGRGGGVYLCGWVAEAGMNIQLADRPARTNNTTLYLIKLNPKIEINGETLKLPPGLFVWETMIDTASNRSNPYSGQIFTNETQHLRFRLGMPFPYTSVVDLNLLLETNNTSQLPGSLTVSLWNFETSQWIQLKNIQWGKNQVEQPGRFVGPAGTIQLSIMNNGTSQYEITRSDFTLIVER